MKFAGLRNKNAAKTKAYKKQQEENEQNLKDEVEQTVDKDAILKKKEAKLRKRRQTKLIQEEQ